MFVLNGEKTPQQHDRLVSPKVTFTFDPLTLIDSWRLTHFNILQFQFSESWLLKEQCWNHYVGGDQHTLFDNIAVNWASLEKTPKQSYNQLLTWQAAGDWWHVSWTQRASGCNNNHNVSFFFFFFLDLDTLANSVDNWKVSSGDTQPCLSGRDHIIQMMGLQIAATVCLWQQIN